MPNFLNDFSAAALIRANRANLYEFFRSLAHSSAITWHQADGLARWRNPLQYAWFNGILCESDPTPASAAAIDESLAYFRSLSTYEISLWLKDGLDLAAWRALLEPRGFRWVQGPPGMSVDLGQLKPGPALPPEVEIRPVSDAAGARDCATTLVNGYGFPPDWYDATLGFVEGIGYSGRYKSYVLYWQGKPVATAAGYFGSEVVGVLSVATLPEARGKGFGAAVTLAPLLEARELGYHIGTLQSSEMGFPVYSRMGFKQDFRVSSFFNTL